jgi:hypothetical protein
VLNGILDDMKMLQSQNRNRFARALRIQADRKKIIEYHERMKTVLDSFNVSDRKDAVLVSPLNYRSLLRS